VQLYHVICIRIRIPIPNTELDLDYESATLTLGREESFYYYFLHSYRAAIFLKFLTVQISIRGEKIKDY
jgi:hypothetical protein